MMLKKPFYLFWIVFFTFTFVVFGSLFAILAGGKQKVSRYITIAFDSSIELLLPESDKLNEEEATNFNHYFQTQSCLFASRANSCYSLAWNSDHKKDVRFINKLALNQKVKINPLLGALLFQAQKYYFRSGGAFDVRQGRLFWAWEKVLEKDSNSQLFQLLSQNQAIDLALQKLFVTQNWNQSLILEQEGTDWFIEKKAPFQLEISSLAKSFAIAQWQKQFSKTNYIINAGSSTVVVKGKNFLPNTKIGIKDPADYQRQISSGKEIATVQSLVEINLENSSLATSSSYELQSSLVIHNYRYHHLINLSTQRPLTEILSVTVFGPDPVQNDVFTTILASLNVVEAKALIIQEQLAAVLVYGKMEAPVLFISPVGAQNVSDKSKN